MDGKVGEGFRVVLCWRFLVVFLLMRDGEEQWCGKVFRERISV